MSLLADILKGECNSIAARYGHAVYLAGSALNVADDIDAIWKLRDIDIVCVLPDQEFFNRFGCDWQHIEGGLRASGRWVAEVGKMSRQFAQHFRNMNVDFKVQSESWQAARHHGKRRERVDTADFGTGFVRGECQSCGGKGRCRCTHCNHCKVCGGCKRT